MQTLKNLGKYTFQHLLENSVSRFKDRPAVSLVSQKPLTYGDFYKKVNEVKELLNNMSVKRGDHIAIFSPSSPSWGIAYFAIVTMGCIAVPLLPDFNEKEVASCLSHSETKAIFTTEKMLTKVNKENLDIIIDMADFTPIKGEVKVRPYVSDFECGEDDIASIIYTSGTTGRSKGVILTHKNFIFTAVHGQYCQRINSYDVCISILPMSHVYEFTIGFLMFILNGGCIYYLEGPPVARFLLPALEKVKPNMMLAVPMVIEKIYKQKVLPSLTATARLKKIYGTRLGRKFLCRIAGKKLRKTFGGRLKFFGIGGAKVDPVIEQFMKDAKFPYALGYGLTETSPLVAYSSPRTTKPGWLGYKMYGIEIKIDNPDPQTGVGELLVKGENVMKGYYKDPELTASVLSGDGWFKTGDLCLITKKGHIMLKGRSKNMILGASGENIYPEDIEFVLNQHPLVSESLVVEGENSSLVAFVQLDENKLNEEAVKCDEENKKNESALAGIQEAMSGISNALMYKKEEILNEIKFFVNSNVNRTSRIDKVESVGSFEKTASQKIKRYLYKITGSGHNDG